jgi:C4-dicarboxylate transporter/malic acid transport protein
MIMGTGILSVSAYFYSPFCHFLKPLAYMLFYFNIFMFFILLVPWSLRWILFFEEAKKDLFHPITTAFYPTIAVAMLVIAAGFLTLFKDYRLSFYFWSAGTALMIFFAFTVPLIMFSHENIKIEHINPGWYIPPVGLIVIPIAGSFFEHSFSKTLNETITLINYSSWGAGFFLYSALLCIIIYRLILHSPLPGKIAPTIWINLGPIGAGSIALINIINNSSYPKEPFFVFTLLFWGFGLWWLITAIIMTLNYIKKSQLNYSMAWWAFIFPLGAFCTSSHLISKMLKLDLINYIGYGIFWLLLSMWTVTLLFTLKHLKEIL